MSNLKKGFFAAPKKQGLGTQQQYEENQKQQKTSLVTITPTSEEKLRKLGKSILYQEVSEFNPSGQMNIEQFIKVVLNFQEEVKKLSRENSKLINSSLQDKLDLRMANQQQKIDALWNYKKSSLIRQILNFRKFKIKTNRSKANQRARN